MSGQKVTPTLLLSLAALLAGFGVFYHYVVAMPHSERVRLELERLRSGESRAGETKRLQRGEREMEFARGLLLHACLQEAATANLDAWSKACKLQSLPSDCSLPSSLAGALGEAAAQRRAGCFEKYPPPR
jgi:hypothetical protein